MYLVVRNEIQKQIRMVHLMNKIAKTKFKALLANNESVLIASLWNLSKEKFDELIDNLENL